MTLAEGEIGQIYTVEHADLPLQVEKRMEALGMTQGLSLIHISLHPAGRAPAG